MESEMIKTAMDLLTPVLEGSIIVAGEYVKACGRRTITAQDVQYGMKYAARNVTGKHIGTMFPELQGSDSDESDMRVTMTRPLCKIHRTFEPTR